MIMRQDAPPAVRERPIIFSGPMVRAILAGTKTQTRRVIKPQPIFQQRDESEYCHWFYGARDLGQTAFETGEMQAALSLHCPFGRPGNRLWCRETWCEKERVDDVVTGGGWLPAEPGCEVLYRADHDDDGPWRSPIYMPRWASRLTLEIVSVRVEQVQDISADDAYHEGVADCEEPGHDDCFYGTHGRLCTFERLWDQINAKRGYGWDTNPWVWAIGFRRFT